MTTLGIQDFSGSRLKSRHRQNLWRKSFKKTRYFRKNVVSADIRPRRILFRIPFWQLPASKSCKKMALNSKICRKAIFKTGMLWRRFGVSSMQMSLCKAPLDPPLDPTNGIGSSSRIRYLGSDASTWTHQHRGFFMDISIKNPRGTFIHPASFDVAFPY